MKSVTIISFLFFFSFCRNTSLFLEEDSYENLSIISPLEEKTCIPPVQQIVINEVMINPSMVDDFKGEWIEIYNPGLNDVNLSGWKIKDNKTDEHIISNLEIKKGGYAVLCRNDNLAENGGVVCNYKYSGFQLSNKEDAIILFNENSIEIDRFEYSGNIPAGASLALKNPYLDNLLIDSWTYSQTVFGAGDKGTPNGKNDVFIYVEDPSCNDNNICTIDICELGVCKNPWKKDCCFSDPDCNDNNICTKDFCGEKNLCINQKIPSCCTKDEDCSDDNPCNKDFCFYNVCRFTSYKVIPNCCIKENKECDDKNPCTQEKCNLQEHQCEITGNVQGCCLYDGNCADKDICTIDECISNKCIHTKKTDCCVQDNECSDTDPCTKDMCIFNLCRHFQIIDGYCCIVDKDCPDDGNPCTEEKCVSGSCKSVKETYCSVPIPYIQTFDKIPSLDIAGWKIKNYGGDVSSNWKLSKQGVLGGDYFLKFFWSPSQKDVKGVIYTPHIDTFSALTSSITNKFKKVTIQWDGAYKHYAGDVKLSLVSSLNGDFQNPLTLWSLKPQKDIPFLINEVILPPSITGKKFFIGFFIETPSSLNLNQWEIDNVKVVAELSPKIISGGEDIVMKMCDKVKKEIKIEVPGHPTAPFIPHPEIKYFGEPYEIPSFASFSKVEFVFFGDYFFTELTLDPKCKKENTGIYNSALYLKNGPPWGILEKLYPHKIVVLLGKGYLIWSPLGIENPSAIKLKETISLTGRDAQIVDNLFYYKDLSSLSGIFVILGVYGKKYVLTQKEGEFLRDYLFKGGRVYIEGGDFFFSDPKTPLHPYLGIESPDGGYVKIEGEIKGESFLEGIAYGYSNSPDFNSWNDIIKPEKGKESRFILRNKGEKEYGVAVAYNHEKYRVISSSISVGGLLEKGTSLNYLIGKYIQFLEDGYPPCSSNTQCNDYEVCTDDSCVNGKCVVEEIINCTTCIDDSDCSEKKACKKDKGYCVDIQGTPFVKDGLNLAFGSNPSKIDTKITLGLNAIVKDLNVKVKIKHTYRGDVKLTLYHAGKSLSLKKENPADGGKNVYETYDAGVFPAEGDLSIFNDTPLGGDWILIAEDSEPILNNGILEGWGIYASYETLECINDKDCDDKNPCTQKKCENNECSITPKNCDDGNSCTIDKCDLKTGECIYEIPPNCPGGCKSHYDCGENDVCLDVDGSLCGEGDKMCSCKAIEGTPYPYTKDLPLAIPDGFPAGVQLTKNIENNAYVKNIKVKVVVEHTKIGDLKVEICKDFLCVGLHNTTGGEGDGFYKVFDYDHVDGPGNLSQFKGKKINGEWNLKVSDVNNGESGKIKAFTVYIVSADCVDDLNCDDGNPCTIDKCENEKCVNKEIQCETPKDTCKGSKCNKVIGKCEIFTKQNGSQCDDGKFCTIDDECSDGICKGVQRDCTYLNKECQKGVCDEVNDKCKVVFDPDGTPCNDGEICTGEDKCKGGICKEGEKFLCGCETDKDCKDDGDLCNGTLWKCEVDIKDGKKKCFLDLLSVVKCPSSNNPCKKYECLPSTGECVEVPEINGKPCEDGKYCTLGDFCDGGVCKGSEEKDCSYLNDKCVTGFCNEGEKSCGTLPKEDGTLCESDGKGCTIDKCSGGVCKFSQNIDCSSLNDDCNFASCENIGFGDYKCIKNKFPDGKSCKYDDDPCTEDKCKDGKCVNTYITQCNADCPAYYFDKDDDKWGLKDDFYCFQTPTGLYRGTKFHDCKDDNPLVNPGMAEMCNGYDDNCDNLIDIEGSAGCVFYYKDDDNDKFGDEKTKKCLCAPSPPLTGFVGGDCDDTDPKINPYGEEKCNGIDDDCDGYIDEEDAKGCKIYFKDVDNDGFGQSENTKCLCMPILPYSANVGEDCDDFHKDINPLSVEKCNGYDDNCDKIIDVENSAGCKIYFKDQDWDGFGNDNDKKCLCKKQGLYKTFKGGDCDDQNSKIKPGIPETCNGFDDNCDNIIDEENSLNCKVYYKDQDLDGYGYEFDNKCLCSAQKPYNVTNLEDCDDEDFNIRPGAIEICDNKDNNCNSSYDEGCDDDNDYYCDKGMIIIGNPSACPKGGGDCNDNDENINPGGGEKCGDGIDNNCNGNIDEECEAVVCKFFEEDFNDKIAEGFSFYSNNSQVKWQVDGHKYFSSPYALYWGNVSTYTYCCGQTISYAETSEIEIPLKMGVKLVFHWRFLKDCDDFCNYDTFSVSINDGGSIDEIYSWCGEGGFCDTGWVKIEKSLDNYIGKKIKIRFSIDTLDDKYNKGEGIYVDEIRVQLGETPIWFYDNDMDGYGIDFYKKSCQKEGKWTATKKGDCDDNDPQVNPSAIEKCNNIDDDCNGFVDDWNSDCSDGKLWSGNGNCYKFFTELGKCWNEAEEACKNWGGHLVSIAGTQEHNFIVSLGCCNGGVWYGGTDEKVEGNWQWSDGSLWGYTKWNTGEPSANAGENYLEGGWCNNKYGWNDMVKCNLDNCFVCEKPSGAYSCKVYFKDNDNDGYGGSEFLCLCSPKDPYDTLIGGDCNDGDNNINPSMKEKCNNIDDDCNGKIDEGCDDDKDGYCDEKMIVQGTPSVCPLGIGDCDDIKGDTTPAGPEICNDGRDNDCDKIIDEGDCIIKNIYFEEDFNDGSAQGWALNSTNALVKWQVDGEKYFSPFNSLYWGNINTHQYCCDTTLSYAETPDILIPNKNGVNLQFWYRFLKDCDEYCDFDTFMVSINDGGTLTDIYYWCGNKGVCDTDWVKITKNLDPWKGKKIKIRFWIDTFDESFNEGEGIYLDDVVVGD